MLKTLIIAVIAFLGILAGHFLGKIAKEEVKPGWKNFKLLRRLFLLLLILTSLSLLWYSFEWILPFIVGFVLSLFIKQRYLFLGFTLVVASTFSSQAFFLFASLIFLYGLPYGTMQGLKKEDAYFFFIPFLLLFFPTQIATYNYTWLAVAAGTLFWKE